MLVGAVVCWFCMVDLLAVIVSRVGCIELRALGFWHYLILCVCCVIGLECLLGWGGVLRCLLLTFIFVCFL